MQALFFLMWFITFIGLLSFITSCFAAQCPIYTCAKRGKECGAIRGNYVGCSDLNSYCKFKKYLGEDTIGVCTKLPELGDKCNITEDILFEQNCYPGLTCDPISFKCVRSPPKVNTGEKCTKSNTCYFSYDDDGNNVTRRCENGKCFGPKIGETCRYLCAEGFCSRTTRVCTPYAQEDGLCLFNECDTGLFCTTNRSGVNVCMPPKVVPPGGSCATNTYNYMMCEGNATCWQDTCKLLNYSSPTYGKLCDSDTECAQFFENCVCNLVKGDTYATCQFTIAGQPSASNSMVNATFEFQACQIENGCTFHDYNCFLTSCRESFCGSVDLEWISDYLEPCQARTVLEICNGLSPNNSNQRNLGPGLIAGIVVGGFCVLGINISGIVLYIRKLRKKKDNGIANDLYDLEPLVTANN